MSLPMVGQAIRGWELAGRRSAWLLAAGLLSEAVFAALALRLPWWRYSDRLYSWSRLLSRGDAASTGKWTAFAACLLGIGVLMGAYLVGWRTLHAGEPSMGQRRIVWSFAMLYSVTLVWVLPITSDLFGYLSQAHQFTDLHGNPFLVSTLAAAGGVVGAGQGQDPLIAAYVTHYSAHPSVYGPGWLLISSLATLGAHDVALGVFYLKAITGLSFLACAWLLEKILRAAGNGQRSSVEGLYLFAWNPLVLLMAGGDAHNDIVMMAAVLLALWFLVRRAPAAACAALALSVWVKYVSVILAPLFALFVWFRSRPAPNGRPAHVKGTRLLGGAGTLHKLIGAGLAATTVSALITVPFRPWEWAAQQVTRLLHPVNWGGQAAGSQARMLAVGLFIFSAAYLAVAARLVWRLTAGAAARPGLAADVGPLLDATFAAALLVFLFGAARSQPWHLIWAAALAGLSSWRGAWPVVTGLSALMLVVQVWVEWGAPGFTF